MKLHKHLFLKWLCLKWLSLRIFLKRNLSKKEKIQLLYFFYNNISFNWFFPQKKLGYIALEKVAITSIKQALLNIENCDNIHSYFNENAKKNVENPQDYFIFTFVRNPFSRLVSCYKDKVVKNKTITYNIYLNAFLKESTNFADFVRRISLIPKNLHDKYFKNQYDIIYKNTGGGQNRAKLYWEV